MENDITLEALDAITNADDTADNSVKKIKDGVKRYSERLNNDRQKIRTDVENQYKSQLSTILGVERASKRHSAGLRTFIVVSLTSFSSFISLSVKSSSIDLRCKSS